MKVLLLIVSGVLGVALGLLALALVITLAIGLGAFVYTAVRRPNQLAMLLRMAWANLLASRINLVIGGLILGGTLVFVVLGAFLSSLNDSMARSVVGSVAGNIQIYSAKSKDDVALYGNMGGEPDLTAMTTFPQIKAALEKLPNVKTVVPMGVSGAVITPGNVVDRSLEKLRALYRAKAGDAAGELKGLSAEEIATRIDAQKSHVRQVIHVLNADAQKAAAILADKAVDPEVAQALARVSTEAFWAGFDADPFESLEFLENKIAPQVTDAQMLFLRYLGTDLDRFQESFDRMEIVDGAAVPKGQRGFLIAKFLYEEQMKLKNARRLDKINNARTLNARTIAGDEELQRFVKENRSQTRDIVLQLDGLKTKAAVAALQEELGDQDADLSALLTRFFDMNDANFERRYKFFYDKLAPLLELYRVRVGDTLTIKAFSRGGAIQSVNVKVYGTFAFKGLEKSPLAGATNLMDLMSFRDLYGYLTADKLEELKEIKQATGAKEVNRDNAEAELFGGDTAIVAEATPGLIDADKELTGAARKLRQEDLLRRVYTNDEINSGVVLNAAVVLKDAAQTSRTLQEIRELSDREHLDLKAVSWQQAAGLLGQIITGFSIILLLSVLVIFFVAGIVINNAMMMATMQRTAMIGTLRAIGAQRSMVLGMVLLEAVTLGFVFGVGGMVAGALIVQLFHATGITAWNDYAYFFFSGPKLRPELAPVNLAVAIAIIFGVTYVATLVPAFVATRVSPLRAMQVDT